MRSASHRQLIVAGGLAAAGIAAALERRHLRRIAADPALRELREAPIGRPVTVVSADGTELHAEVFGADDRPTIVLIHGWTEAIRLWTYVIRELERDFRVVAYDLRGHGESEAAADQDYSLERF